jgi:hypothetical protein
METSVAKGLGASERSGVLDVLEEHRLRAGARVIYKVDAAKGFDDGEFKSTVPLSGKAMAYATANGQYEAGRAIAANTNVRGKASCHSRPSIGLGSGGNFRQRRLDSCFRRGRTQRAAPHGTEHRRGPIRSASDRRPRTTARTPLEFASRWWRLS